MAWLTELRLWCRALFNRRRVEQDLDREMHFHIEMEIEQNVRAGMSLADARRTALVAFGGVERSKEAVRDERGLRLLDDLSTDLRLAFRVLRSQPFFSAVAAGTIAVGIGATTAVFGLANQVLYKPVPGIASPSHVVRFVYEKVVGQPTGISYPNIQDLRRASRTLTGFAGYTDASLQVSGGEQPPSSVEGEVVTADYFDVLGVRPSSGRFFTEAEAQPGSETRAVVIGDAFRQSRFGDAPVLGRQLKINAIDYTIIGVAAPAFRGSSRRGLIDVWLPASAYGTIRHRAEYGRLDRRMSIFMFTVGRLRPGVTAAMAQADIRTAMAVLIEEYPVENGIYSDALPTVLRNFGTESHLLDYLTMATRLLLGIALLVLVIACANTANLLLFRGVRRRGEFAVRRALGASVERMLRQHLTEGVVLALLGCAIGIPMSIALTKTLAKQGIEGFAPAAGLLVDWRVLAFAVGIALATGVLFGVVGALFGVRADHLAHLKDSARLAVPGTARVRGALTVLQIAASAILVIAALLLTRTVINLQRVQLGFDPTRVVVTSVDPDPQGYSPARLDAFRRSLLSDVSTRPGVERASIASSAPFAGTAFIADFRLPDGAPTVWPVDAAVLSVTPEYFETLGLARLAGQTFARETGDDRDRDVVVSQSVARTLFGDADPIGKQIVQREYRRIVTLRVIGVVPDIRSSSLREATRPIVYRPIALGSQSFTTVLVRSSLPVRDVEAMVRDATKRLDPALPLFHVERLDESVGRYLSMDRLFARLVGTLAVLAVVLAAIGLYGVIAYSVAERTREIGIRVALGADPSLIVRLVVGQAGRIVVLGVAVGVVTAVASSRILAHRVFGLAPTDVATYAIGAATIVLIGIVASAHPARTAARVNPVEALRHD